MGIKSFILVVALFALLFVVQAAPTEEQDKALPDILFIKNIDTHPTILSPLEVLQNNMERNSCPALLCSRLCAILGFKYGRCDSNNVCVCSNT
ncbi:unnamed protein product, partial [Brenthis ino]